MYFRLKERLGGGLEPSNCSDSSSSRPPLRAPVATQSGTSARALGRPRGLGTARCPRRHTPSSSVATTTWSRRKLSASEFTSIVQTIENYGVRRFVCFIPTNQFNKIFPGLYNQIRREAHPSILVASDPSGRARIPEGRRIPQGSRREQPLRAGDRQAKIRFILERIERHLAGKEPPKLETVSV